MKLLVTGGAGFIGSNFIHYWMEKYPEDEIVNLDALTYAGNLENLQTVENLSNYTFVKGDITNKELVQKLVKDVDIIVHYAAESHVDRSILDPTAFIKTNVLGTQVLLDAARKHNTRFHHVSTDEVYGTLAPDESAFTENSPYKPRSPYAASKAASDHLVRAYHTTYGLPVTISNCSNNYGPYHFPEKLIPLFITNLMEGKKVPVYGDGGQIRDWIHTIDHARGVDAIIKNGKIGATYLLGGDNQPTNLEITKILLNLLNKAEDSIEFVEDRAGHDRRYDIDFSKTEQELGWKPQINLEDGLKDTVEWYKKNQDWWRRCKSGEYQNYYNNQYKNR